MICGCFSDGTSLYVGGTDGAGLTGTNTGWRLEKRALTSGALDTSFAAGGVLSQSLSANAEIPKALLFNGSDMFLVGEDRSLGATDHRWRIEKRTK